MVLPYGTAPSSPAYQADALLFELQEENGGRSRTRTYEARWGNRFTAGFDCCSDIRPKMEPQPGNSPGHARWRRAMYISTSLRQSGDASLTTGHLSRAVTPAAS